MSSHTSTNHERVTWLHCAISLKEVVGMKSSKDFNIASWSFTNLQKCIWTNSNDEIKQNHALKLTEMYEFRCTISPKTLRHVILQGDFSNPMTLLLFDCPANLLIIIAVVFGWPYVQWTVGVLIIYGTRAIVGHKTIVPTVCRELKNNCLDEKTGS